MLKYQAMGYDARLINSNWGDFPTSRESLGNRHWPEFAECGASVGQRNSPEGKREALLQTSCEMI